MSAFVILRQTVMGQRLYPITKSEIDKGMKDGTIVRLPDGIFKEVEKPVSKKADEAKEKKTESKKTYKTKVMKAE